MQNKLNLSIKDYKEFLVKFSTIEIEIVPVKKIYSKFINICENEKLYYHIYINDNREEIKNKHYIYENDKITKIRIIIDYQIKSFENLFKNSKCIEYINFIKFHRNNITNMSNMFSKCSSLKELNLSNFNTSNDTYMSNMFSICSSLKELNLSNFNTSNVTNMSNMFYRCSSLKELNLSNFNTNNVIYMSYIFFECLSLKELNLSNFNTSNVTNMVLMFYRCSDDLKKKILAENKNIKAQAFY